MNGLLAFVLALLIECGLLALMSLLYSKWQKRHSPQQEPVSRPYLRPEARQ